MIEAYQAIGELYMTELKKLGGGTMTSEELVVCAARLDAFKEVERTIFDLMYPQDNKKTDDGGNRQRPEK